MSETWLEQHFREVEALCVNNNGVFVRKLADLGLEQQFRATEAFGAPPLSEDLRHFVGRHQAGKIEKHVHRATERRKLEIDQSKFALSRACCSLDRHVARQRAILSMTFTGDRAFMLSASHEASTCTFTQSELQPKLTSCCLLLKSRKHKGVL